jgi:hypothetical protein
MVPEKPDDVVEKVAVAIARQAALLSCLGERLAREAGAENIVLWDLGWAELSNVGDGRDPEVQGVKIAKFRALLARQDARMAQAVEADMKAAQSREEVNEAIPSPSFHLRLCIRPVLGAYILRNHMR